MKKACLITLLLTTTFNLFGQENKEVESLKNVVKKIHYNIMDLSSPPTFEDYKEHFPNITMEDFRKFKKQFNDSLYALKIIDITKLYLDTLNKNEVMRFINYYHKKQPGDKYKELNFSITQYYLDSISLPTIKAIYPYFDNLLNRQDFERMDFHSVNCKDFQEGEFIIEATDYTPEYHIIRTPTSQKEIYDDKYIETSITWSNDCEHILTYLKTNDPNVEPFIGSKLHVKIYKVTEEGYLFKGVALMNGFVFSGEIKRKK